MPRRAGDRNARRVAAGQRHRRDTPVGDQRLHFGARRQNRAEDRVRRAIGEEALDFERAAGHVRGVLEDDGVARHQRGGRRAEHLPVGEVPRHDRQHDAERPIGDVALGRGGGRLSRRRGSAPRRSA